MTSENHAGSQKKSELQAAYDRYRKACREYQGWLSTLNDDEIDRAEATMESALEDYMDARKRYFANA